MDALRRELERLERSSPTASLRSASPRRFRRAWRYGAFREALDKAEDEWLALEMLREDLERQ